MSTWRALLVGVAACGGKADEAPRPEPASSSKPSPARPSPAPPQPGPGPAPDDRHGSCTVEVRGALTADQTSAGGTSRSVTSYWFAPGDTANVMFGDGRIGLVLNCTGKALSLSFVSRQATETSVPFGPKTYRLTRRASEMTVLGTVGKASLTSLTGTVDVTAFDARHIAGTFELAGKALPGNGAVNVTGRFDFACPGFSGCAN
jgi:hypothetical protein